jgi:hypothetical protein
MQTRLLHVILTRCCLLLLGLMMHTGSQAQQRHVEDVLYLRNGSIIRGKIIEQVVGDYVKIEIMGGSVFVFDESEIDQITVESALYRSITIKLRKELIPISYRTRAIYHLVSFDLGFARDQWGVFATSNLRYRTGYYFNRYLSLGLGSGFDFYEDGAMMIPLFADVRGDLFQKAVSPHYFLNLGYGFAGARGWSMNRLDGGLMGQIGGGIKINTRRKYEWLLTSGFRFQQTYQEFDLWTGRAEPVRVQGNLRYNRIFFEIAMGF